MYIVHMVCVHKCACTYTHIYTQEHVCTDTQVDGLPLDFSLSDCMRILAWQFHSCKEKSGKNLKKNVIIFIFLLGSEKTSFETKLKLSKNGHLCTS